jgi:hypothetical protein
MSTVFIIKWRLLTLVNRYCELRKGLGANTCVLWAPEVNNRRMEETYLLKIKALSGNNPFTNDNK